MGDLNLKTTYKDDVLDTTKNAKRKFNMIQNEDGTVSFEDVTDYSQVGDSFGAADINATNEAIFELNDNLANTNTNVSNLSNSVNSCFQSVSSGKALVASAITGKGVPTASDATFATMANNVRAISKGKCIYLGTGTYFNVQSICNSNGIDWKSLTADNFIVGVSAGGSTSTSSPTIGAVPVWARADGFSIGKSYNPSSGELTISGVAQTITQGYYAASVSQTATQVLTAFAYLIYTS